MWIPFLKSAESLTSTIIEQKDITDAQSDWQNTSSQSENFKEAQVSTNRLQQAFYVTARGMILIILFLIIGGFLYSLAASVSFLSIVPYILTFTAFFSVLFFFTGSIHGAGLYRNYSGYGIAHYHHKWTILEEQFDHNLMVDNIKISGIVELFWGQVKKVKKLSDQSVALYTQSRLSFLSLIAKPPLIIQFQSAEDCDRFMSKVENIQSLYRIIVT